MSVMNKVTAPVRAPYDFARAAQFFSSRSVLPVGEGSVGEDNHAALIAYTSIAGQAVKMRLRCLGGNSPALAIGWRKLAWKAGSSESPSRVTGKVIAGYVRKTFSADVRLQPFYRQLKSDKQLQALPFTLSGLKPTLTDSVYDACIWAIVGQQVSLSFARTLKRRVFRRYGRLALDEGREIHLTPLAESLASARVSDLRKLQLSESKALYLKGISELVTSGELDVERLGELSFADAYERLIAIRGIGQWSANYILMRGAGHLDALPLGDAGLRRAVRAAYKLGRNPEEKEIVELAEKFRPYRSLYTLYLWQAFA